MSDPNPQRIETLEFETKVRCLMLLKESEKNGIILRIVQALRTSAEQDALYAQGRKDLWLVNELRRALKWPDLTKYDNRVVTNARAWESWHNFGRAFDVVPMKDGVPDWESTLWSQIGFMGEACGLEWGGRWSHPDKPHFQFTNGLTLETARSMKDGPTANH